MLRDTSSAARQLDPKRRPKVSPRHEAAYFQNAHPSRNATQKRTWHGRNQNIIDLKELSDDWTQCQEEQARHKAWKLHNELDKIKGAFCRSAQYKILQRFLSDGRSEQKFEGQDVHCCPQWYFLAQEGRSSLSLSAGKEYHTKDNTRLVNQDREWHRPFHI